MSAGVRVVVTGIGTVLPDAVAAPTSFDASGFDCRCAAEVRTVDFEPHFRQRKALKLAHRTTRFAVAAASLALADARGAADLSADALGVIVGTSGSDPQVADLSRALAGDDAGRAREDIRVFADRVMNGLTPLWLLVGLPNMPSSHVAIQLAARGPNSTVMTDWIAGLQAIAEGAEWIAGGEADAVLAGGADSALHPFCFAALQREGFFEPSATPPFIPGEGAAILLLEAHDHAVARGAPVHAELLAWTCASTRAAAREALAAELDARGETRPRRDAVTHRARLGHALAATGAIDAALAMRDTHDPVVVVCDTAGASGQAAAVAFATAAAITRTSS